MSRPTRNSVYSDIAALKEAGFEIETYRSVQNRYKLVQRGFSAAVYTQTTDCEGEVNGLLTYDRKVVKMNEAQVRAKNQQLCHSLDK